MFLAILFIDIVSNPIPVAGIKVDVDVRLLGPLQAKKALKEETPGNGVNLGDTKAVCNR